MLVSPTKYKLHEGWSNISLIIALFPALGTVPQKKD